MSILVVEDHESTAQAIERYLRLRGYKVHVAVDVTSARRLAESVRFDLLLSDIGLPDGTGWELLRELRMLRTVKAIAMSGYIQMPFERAAKKPDFSSTWRSLSRRTSWIVLSSTSSTSKAERVSA